ncbi:MAG: hypothetical protein ABFS16_12850 [Bacteroidota bacterium]
MKFLKTFVLFTLPILFICSACQKTETYNDENLKNAKSVKVKGKPVKEPPYELADTPAQLQIYGVWHAGNDYCTWGTVRELQEFDANNNWIIDRGDGTPSVNLVVLSFVNPLKLLNETIDATTLNGIPRAMTPEIVDYFKDAGIRVMLSIGGITYTDDWNTALEQNALQLGLNAAEVAQSLGVGIEIDYEENRNPNLDGLQTFINAYRSILPYDASGVNHAARLTIDLAAGDRWLIDICRKATTDWLTTDSPVLDYANAMVPARQPSVSGAIANWDEHIDGKPQYAPPIPPLAPCKFTGALYLTDRKAIPECVDFYSSLQNATSDYVTRIMPNGASNTHGMLGYMFWAAECPSTRKLCATDCTGGVGQGSEVFNIPVPMPALRQN